MYTPIPGKPQEVGTETEVLAMVRSVLTEEIDPPRLSKRKKKAAARAEAQPASRAPEQTADVARTLGTSAPAAAPVVAPEKGDAPAARAALFPKLGSQDRVDPEAPGKLGRFTIPASAGVVLFGFHIRPRHVLFAGLALMVYLRPMWFIMAFVLVVLALGMMLSTVGMDPIWNRIMRRLHKLDETNPKRAAEMRKRLDRVAGKWDRILDMLPDGTVDSLYFPDLQTSESLAQEDAALQARLDRMVREA